MACEITLWNSKTGKKQTFTCDEENAAKLVEDEHGGSGSGKYKDVKGSAVSADWSTWRLIKFSRTRDK